MISFAVDDHSTTCNAPNPAVQKYFAFPSYTSHAHRRTSVEELKKAKYKGHLQDGKTTKEASEMAVQDVVEHLGHSRNRRDLALAYLLL